MKENAREYVWRNLQDCVDSYLNNPAGIVEDSTRLVYYRNAGRRAFYHVPGAHWVQTGRALCKRYIGRPGYFMPAREYDATRHKRLCKACARLYTQQERMS